MNMEGTPLSPGVLLGKIDCMIHIDRVKNSVGNMGMLLPGSDGTLPFRHRLSAFGLYESCSDNALHAAEIMSIPDNTRIVISGDATCPAGKILLDPATWGVAVQVVRENLVQRSENRDATLPEPLVGLLTLTQFIIPKMNNPNNPSVTEIQTVLIAWNITQRERRSTDRSESGKPAGSHATYFPHAQSKGWAHTPLEAYPTKRYSLFRDPTTKFDPSLLRAAWTPSRQNWPDHAGQQLGQRRPVLERFA